MKLKELGEFGVIERFSKQFKGLIPDGTKGIGDDCAVYPFNKDESFLITTDLLVEDIHFLKEKILPEELGHKSLAVNLSDIAAMGGTPIMSFLSIALPKNIDVEWIDKFFEGYNKLSSKHNTALMGGDTTKSPDKIIINVAVIGKAGNHIIKYRSGAKTGDIICTTGFTGESGAGLKILLENIERNELTNFLVNKHNRPDPCITEGNFLAEYKGVNSMMDISDGIDSDLKHILKASEVSAEIDLEKIPVSKELNEVSSKYNFNAKELALSAGEDYQLLLTVDQSEFPTVAKEFEQKFNNPLYSIGRITSGDFNLRYLLNKNEINLSQKGFDHFK